jgi:hypothetical protein
MDYEIQLDHLNEVIEDLRRSKWVKNKR